VEVGGVEVGRWSGVEWSMSKSEVGLFLHVKLCVARDDGEYCPRVSAGKFKVPRRRFADSTLSSKFFMLAKIYVCNIEINRTSSLNHEATLKTLRTQ
jgi:hypothetical protein